MKIYDVGFASSAEEGVLEIVDFIAMDNPIRAVSFVEELTASLKKTLSIFPYSGKVVEGLDIGDEIRVFPHKNYNSYYRVVEASQRVEVLFIFNAKRDIEALMTDL